MFSEIRTGFLMSCSCQWDSFTALRFPWQSTASSSRPATELRPLPSSRPAAESPTQQLTTTTATPVQEPSSPSRAVNLALGAVSEPSTPSKQIKIAEERLEPAFQGEQKLAESSSEDNSRNPTAVEAQPTQPSPASQGEHKIAESSSEDKSRAPAAVEAQPMQSSPASHGEQKLAESLSENKSRAPTAVEAKPTQEVADLVAESAPISTETAETPSASSKFTETEEHPKLSMDEKPVSGISLASENSEAYTSLGTESEENDGSAHIHRGYKTNPDHSPEATTDGEKSFNFKRKQDSRTKDSESKAYVNSNTQGFTNSLVLDSSVIERNPGVQLTFSLGSGISIL